MKKLIEELWEKYSQSYHYRMVVDSDLFELAILEAMKAQREACAKVFMTSGIVTIQELYVNILNAEVE